MSTICAPMPTLSHTARASTCDWGSLLRYGMNTATTFSVPSDDTASAVTNDESTPPERPTMTRSNPTLRTPSAMNPRSSSMTKGASTASVSASESIGLGVVDIVSFVAQERIGHASATDRTPLEAVQEHGFLGSADLGDHVPHGVDDPRPPPEADAVLESRPVAVQDIGSEELCIGAGHDVVAARGAHGLSLQLPASR